MASILIGLLGMAMLAMGSSEIASLDGHLAALCDVVGVVGVMISIGLQEDASQERGAPISDRELQNCAESIHRSV